MSNNMAKIAEARKTVEQLKLEVNIDRMKVSGAVGEIFSWGGGGRERGGRSEPGYVEGGAWSRGEWEGGPRPGAWPIKAWSGQGAGIWALAEGPKPLGRVNCISAPRLQVSQAAAELLAFCETHAKDDPLVTPVPAAENPFRDKRLFCTLL